jgi:hypothetical protein
LWVVFFFFCLSEAAAWLAPPSVICGSLFAWYPQVQEISSVVYQLSYLEVPIHCTCLLGACFFASPPFSGARSVIRQSAPCYQNVVMVHCLFFNFAEPLDFGCCSLAQKMSFVVHYLPYFRQWLITHPLSAFLPFQPFVY